MVLKVELEEDLEKKFREAAMRKYGYMRGSLQKATHEALEEWVMQKSTTIPKISQTGDSFKLVEGILSHLRGKKSSVQLQHEVGKLWTKKH